MADCDVLSILQRYLPNPGCRPREDEPMRTKCRRNSQGGSYPLLVQVPERGAQRLIVDEVSLVTRNRAVSAYVRLCMVPGCTIAGAYTGHTDRARPHLRAVKSMDAVDADAQLITHGLP